MKRREGGFTIIELVVVMGLLGFFLVFLTQLLTDGLRIWQSGEERAALEDRCSTALRALSHDLKTVRAVSDRQFAPGRQARFARMQRAGGLPPQAGRLYATWRAFDAGKTVTVDRALSTPAQLDWFPELRMVVTLDASETDELMREDLRARIVEEEGQIPPEELEERVRERLAELPRTMAAEVALRVVPTGDENGCYLALYRDRRLLSAGVGQRWVDLAKLPGLGEPIASDLLYVEYLFRSQLSESWTLPPASKGGPEACWDSARGGTFPDDHPVLAFSLDLDEDSARDPLDDVMPSWVQLRVVVDESPGLANTALLATDIDARSTEVDVEFPERLPQVDEPVFVKIGSEWIRYTGIQGSRLMAVKRGQRRTAPRSHKSTARVHVGRESVIRVKVAVGREYWNG